MALRERSFDEIMQDFDEYGEVEKLRTPVKLTFTRSRTPRSEEQASSSRRATPGARKKSSPTPRRRATTPRKAPSASEDAQVISDLYDDILEYRQSHPGGIFRDSEGYPTVNNGFIDVSKFSWKTGRGHEFKSTFPRTTRGRVYVTSLGISATDSSGGRDRINRILRAIAAYAEQYHPDGLTDKVLTQLVREGGATDGVREREMASNRLDTSSEMATSSRHIGSNADVIPSRQIPHPVRAESIPLATIPPVGIPLARSSRSSVRSPRSSVSSARPVQRSVSPVRSPKTSVSSVRPVQRSVSPVRSPKTSVSPVGSPKTSVSPVRSPKTSVSPVRSPRTSVPPVESISPVISEIPTSVVATRSTSPPRSGLGSPVRSSPARRVSPVSDFDAVEPQAQYPIDESQLYGFDEIYQ